MHRLRISHKRQSFQILRATPRWQLLRGLRSLSVVRRDAERRRIEQWFAWNQRQETSLLKVQSDWREETCIQSKYQASCQSMRHGTLWLRKAEQSFQWYRYAYTCALALTQLVRTASHVTYRYLIIANFQLLTQPSPKDEGLYWYLFSTPRLRWQRWQLRLHTSLIKSIQICSSTSNGMKALLVINSLLDRLWRTNKPWRAGKEAAKSSGALR